MSGMAWLHIVKTFLVVSFILGRASATTLCADLKTELGNITVLPGDSEYPAISKENWSQTAWKSPLCIVKPVDPAAVQTVLRHLRNRHVKFAVRSGGHSPNPFAANIDNGVLIDLSGMNKVDVDTTRNTTLVGGGARWRDVYNELDKYNRTVTGGRVTDVGVGGLTLGGGLSYLSNLYGMVADNVENFEVVLANSSLVNANATSNQDLFWALKGGSNNFGIVTHFTLRTYPIHQIWGGVRLYSMDKLSALMSAVLQYQNSPTKDPYANLMLQAFPTNVTLGCVLTIVYLKPEANPAIFAPFSSIPTVADFTSFQTLTQLMEGQNVPSIPRFHWRATSFKPDASLYQNVSDIVTTQANLASIESITAGSVAIGVQPISSSLVEAGNARGGNALGLQSVDQTWFVLDTGWWSNDGDTRAYDGTKAIVDKIEQASKASNKYLPYLFMNDASWDQNVIGSYGQANVAKLKAVQQRYDPDLAFQNLASGGFKLPS